VSRYNSLLRQQSVSSGSMASLTQSTPSMNKADVVRFELENAESRVELCKVRHMSHVILTSLYGCTPAMMGANCYIALMLFIFSAHNLRSRPVHCHQTLPCVWQWPEFIKLCKKFCGLLSQNLFFAAQKPHNLVPVSENFATWSSVSPVLSYGKCCCKLQCLLHMYT